MASEQNEIQAPPAPVPYWLRITKEILRELKEINPISAITILLIFTVASMYGWIGSPAMDRLKVLEWQGWQMIHAQRVMCDAIISLTNKPNNCNFWKDGQQIVFKEFERYVREQERQRSWRLK